MKTPSSGRLSAAHRLMRLAIAGVALGFALGCPFAAQLGAPLQWISGLAGAALLVTAVTGACPALAMLRRRWGG